MNGDGARNTCNQAVGRTCPPERGGLPIPRRSINSLCGDLMVTISSFLPKRDVANLLSIDKKTANMKLNSVLLKQKSICYGQRFTGSNALYTRAVAIMKSRRYNNGTNDKGFRVGHHVLVISDNANSHWKRRYKPSKLVGRYGYVVGVTPKFVHIVVGNMWADNIQHYCKKNESVVKA